MREQIISRRYLEELDDIRRLVAELVADGWPLPRIVIRARNLYRAAYRREVLRYRERAVEAGAIDAARTD